MGKVSSRIVSLEIEHWDWRELHVMNGDASFVPGVIVSLLEQNNEDDAMIFYWDIENSVFVQGQQLEAAPATLSVVMAALSSGSFPDVRGVLIELVLQMVIGSSHEEAVKRGNSGLGDQCRDIARRGIWVFYKELFSKYSQEAKAILEVVETDRRRMEEFLSSAGL